MGLWEQFPYANFHELNLDWILQKLRELENRVGNLEDAIKNLKQEILDEVNQRLDQFEQDIMQQIDVKFEQFKTEILNEVSVKLDELEQKLTVMINNVEQKLDTYIAETAITIGGMQTDITNIKSKIAVIEGDINTINNTITEIQQKMEECCDEIKADIEKINGDISSINSTISTIQSSINNIINDVDSINGEISKIKTDIGTINTEIGNLDDRVTALEDAEPATGGSSYSYLCVNAQTGNDTTGDGTAAKPFKTVTAALTWIQNNLDHQSYAINIYTTTNITETLQPSVLTNNMLNLIFNGFGSGIYTLSINGSLLANMIEFYNIGIEGAINNAGIIGIEKLEFNTVTFYNSVNRIRLFTIFASITDCNNAYTYNSAQNRARLYIACDILLSRSTNHPTSGLYFDHATSNTTWTLLINMDDTVIADSQIPAYVRVWNVAESSGSTKFNASPTNINISNYNTPADIINKINTDGLVNPGLYIDSGITATFNAAFSDLALVSKAFIGNSDSSAELRIEYSINFIGKYLRNLNITAPSNYTYIAEFVGCIFMECIIDIPSTINITFSNCKFTRCDIKQGIFYNCTFKSDITQNGNIYGGNFFGCVMGIINIDKRNQLYFEKSDILVSGYIKGSLTNGFELRDCNLETTNLFTYSALMNIRGGVISISNMNNNSNGQIICGNGCNWMAGTIPSGVTINVNRYVLQTV